MRGYFVEAGYSAAEVDAVLAVKPDRIDLVPLQLEAVRMFNTLPEAPSLAAANKRIGNILKKAARVPPAFDGHCSSSTRAGARRAIHGRPQRSRRALRARTMPAC